MTKTAVVTGAYGFLGRHASRRLAEEGWRVIGIGHGGWTHREAQQWGVSKWHHASIGLDALFTYAEEPELILHCAGSGSVAFSMSHPLQDFQRTVGTTAAVLEFARLQAPEARLVLASSGAVYGAVERTPIEEDDALRPVSPYGAHKVIAEQLCRSYCQHHAVRVAVVRFFSLFGPELRKQLLWDASQLIHRGGNGFFGTGEERRDLLHVGDAVSLLLDAARNASTECPTVNGGNGEGVAVREILSVLFAAYGRQDAPTFSQQARGGDPAVYIASTTRAREWGWAPLVPWRQGVSEYAAWFQANIP